MISMAALLWDLLSGVGGTLALTFIVALALGINAVALLFFGSAVVALERFARVMKSWRTAVSVWLVWSLVMGVAFLHADRPELAVERFSAQAQALGIASAAGAFAVGATGLVVWALLRWFSSFVLASVAPNSLTFSPSICKSTRVPLPPLRMGKSR